MLHQTLVDEYVAGPKLLRDAVAGLTEDQLDARPISGKWSIRQVICHISDFEPVYADRMKRVLAESQPNFASGDPDLFATALAYDARKLDEELDVISATRRQMATILRTLPAEAFLRSGKHSESGLLTLTTLLERITSHVPHHLRFIEEKRRALGVT